MSVSHSRKFLVGAVAVVIAGTAAANTNINATSTGDLFLNIVDTSNNTSYLFDTGITQAAFNGNGNYSFSLASDTNLTGFLNGTDTFNYSVVSATKSGLNPTIDITGGVNGSLPASTTNFKLQQSQSPINLFLTFANTVASTSSTSAVIPTGSAQQGFWGGASVEGVVSKQLFNVANPPFADNAPLNTALSFFQGVGTTVSTFAGTWNFNSSTDLLTYGSAASVPLPTPLLLVLSGLALFGLIGRRGTAVRGLQAA